MTVWLNLIGGFGLLLFGIKTMSEALQALAVQLAKDEGYDLEPAKVNVGS